MIKQIEIHGQCFELYSPDDGRTWSSNPQSMVACGRRKKMLRLELQKRFERRAGWRISIRINSVSDRQRRKIMNETYWIKYSVLAVVVAVALAAPVGAATPDAWITTKTKLSLNHGGCQRDGHPCGHHPRQGYLARKGALR
jgi:hypothetical protein